MCQVGVYYFSIYDNIMSFVLDDTCSNIEKLIPLDRENWFSLISKTSANTYTFNFLTKQIMNVAF